MKIQAELGLNDKIAVEATDKRYTEFIVRLGDIEFTLTRTSTEELHKQLEEMLYSEDEWSRNLLSRVDELEEQLREREATIDDLDSELESHKDTMSNSYFM